MRVCIHSSKVKKGERGRMWKKRVKNGGNSNNSRRSLENYFLKHCGVIITVLEITVLKEYF